MRPRSLLALMDRLSIRLWAWMDAWSVPPPPSWHEQWQQHDTELRESGDILARQHHHQIWLKVFARHGACSSWRWQPVHLDLLASATPRQWALWFMRWEQAQTRSLWNQWPSCLFVAMNLRELGQCPGAPESAAACLAASASGLRLCPQLIRRWWGRRAHALPLPWAWQEVFWTRQPRSTHRDRDRLLSPSWSLSHGSVTAKAWSEAWYTWVVPSWHDRPGEAADAILDHVCALMYGNMGALDSLGPAIGPSSQVQAASDFNLAAMMWCTSGRQLSWETWGEEARWVSLDAVCRRLAKDQLRAFDLAKWHACRDRVCALREAHLLSCAIAPVQSESLPRRRI